MKNIILTFFLLLPAGTRAQFPDSLALGNLARALDALQQSSLMYNGIVGFSLASADNGREILSVNAGKSLPSASTLKLYTTATALAVLGPGFTYKTYLEYEGSIRNDTLYGHLYIRGTGDPSLGSSRFRGYPGPEEITGRWRDAVSAAGIRHISGDIIADNSAFTASPLADSWSWGDLGNYYGAGVNGVNINENAYSVVFRPGKTEGAKAELVGTHPVLFGKRMTNLVTTGKAGSGDKVNIYAAPGADEIRMTGTVPRGPATFTVKGALTDGALYAAELLSHTLLLSGISLGGKPQVIAVSGAYGARSLLHTQTSPPLSEICRQTNLWSVNIFADGLLKSTALRLGSPADFDEAVAATVTYWQNLGLPLAGFYPKDGSGLSPSGTVTASNLTGLLHLVYHRPEFSAYYETLAVLGQTGTVRNLAKNTRAAGNLRVKSGSIEGTRAYAGYVTTRSGALLSFSVNLYRYAPDRAGEAVTELTKIMTLIGEL